MPVKNGVRYYGLIWRRLDGLFSTKLLAIRKGCMACLPQSDSQPSTGTIIQLEAYSVCTLIEAS